MGYGIWDSKAVYCCMQLSIDRVRLVGLDTLRMV